MNASPPDLSLGVSADDVPEGTKLLGHVGDDPVLLVRTEGVLHAVGAHCTHYSAPLVDGLVVGQTIRCPWHHAAFDLATGTPSRPPALHALSCWRVEERDGRVRVTGRAAAPSAAVETAVPDGSSNPTSVVILGGGAAGSMAAETLRAEGYDGAVTVVDPEGAAPYDRPNLSKDYLAGTAPETWLPVRDDAFFAEQKITRRLGVEATAIDAAQKTVTLSDGTALPYGALLIATGAAPMPLAVDDPHRRVRYLRSLADAKALIAAADAANTVVIAGASFLGLEVAASLRARGLAVRIVAPDPVPFHRILGPEVGAFIQSLHEQHGVSFHLGTTIAAVHMSHVVLSDGHALPADLVIAAVGATPRVDVARRAGLATQRGIVVDEFLRTSDPDIYAVGDAADWFDGRRGEHLHVEHWVVAQRQGKAAARNILGRREAFDAVPFFWSQHYDVTISYTGAAPRWDTVTVEGSLEAHDCTIRYHERGTVRAIATIGRDAESLAAELDFEQSGTLA
ncbi:MAG: FAD-dependent oxidoreductase [Gemmatimonadetes bacterium]|nr:FAD-dependent oxidoreductase [Gemmatimonadota bacterium]